MKAIHVIFTLVFCMFASLAHADTNRKAIVGKWSFVDGKLTGSLELTANGKVVMSAKKKSMKRGATGQGTYKWIDDKSIEMTVIFDNVPKQVTFQVVKLEPKALTLTDDRGDTKTFKRVR